MQEDEESKRPTAQPERSPPEAAVRALKEAEERRKQARDPAARPKEIGGPSGPEPTRYGDWESKGIASDF
jgi:hypothetical protein